MTPIPIPKGLPKALGEAWDGPASEYSDWAHITGHGDGFVEWRNLAGELTDERPDVAEVVDCWFNHNGDPADEGTGTELHVYAVVRFTDGRWGYVEAWNDFTGWGCQDGIDWRISDEGPERLYEVGMTDEGRARLAWKP